MFVVRVLLVCVCVWCVGVSGVAFGMQVDVHVKADPDLFAITASGASLREGFHSPGVPGGHASFRSTGGSGKSGGSSAAPPANAGCVSSSLSSSASASPSASMNGFVFASSTDSSLDPQLAWLVHALQSGAHVTPVSTAVSSLSEAPRKAAVAAGYTSSETAQGYRIDFPEGAPQFSSGRVMQSLEGDGVRTSSGYYGGVSARDELEMTASVWERIRNAFKSSPRAPVRVHGSSSHLNFGDYKRLGDAARKEVDETIDVALGKNNVKVASGRSGLDALSDVLQDSKLPLEKKLDILEDATSADHILDSDNTRRVQKTIVDYQQSKLDAQKQQAADSVNGVGGDERARWLRKEIDNTIRDTRANEGINNLFDEARHLMEKRRNIAGALADLKQAKPDEYKKLMEGLKKRNPDSAAKLEAAVKSEEYARKLDSERWTCNETGSGSGVSYTVSGSSNGKDSDPGSGQGFVSEVKQGLRVSYGADGVQAMVFDRNGVFKKVVDQAVALSADTLSGVCDDEGSVAVAVGSSVNVGLDDVCKWADGSREVRYEALSVGDVDRLQASEAAFAFASGFLLDNGDGKSKVFGRSWWEDSIINGVSSEVNRSDVAFGADAERISIEGQSMVYEASKSNFKASTDTDVVLVRAVHGNKSRVFPVNISVVDHAPVCESGALDVLERYGADGSGMVTDGIAGGTPGVSGSLIGKATVERGSRFEAPVGCFDADGDLETSSVNLSGDGVQVVGKNDDTQSLVVGVAGEIVGDGGSVTFSGVDKAGHEGDNVVVPVTIKDVPFVCKAVKGRLVVRVKPGDEKRVDVPCGLKNDVKPIVKVSGSGGVFEDRNGTFKVDVDQGSGGVSLVVGVNAGVVGQFTRQVTLLNGDLRTVLPVDVVVDSDGSNGGGEGSGSGGGGKYAPPVVDSPGPKPSLPGGEGKTGGSGGDGSGAGRVRGEG